MGSILAGVWIGGRAPWLGVGMIAAGALAINGLWWWALPITGTITLVIVGFAVHRARRMTRAETAALPKPQRHKRNREPVAPDAFAIGGDGGELNPSSR